MERFLQLPALVASLAPGDLSDAHRLVSLAPLKASAIEYRLDMAAGPIEPRRLLDLDGRPAIMTWRTVAEGGKFAGSRDEYRRLSQAAYDAGAVVDVEFESGLLDDPDFLPDRRRVIGSRHTANPFTPADVGRFRSFNVAAAKLVHTSPGSVEEAAATLRLLGEPAGKAPLAAFAMGKIGLFTRLLAPRLGSALTYGSVEAATGDGQPALAGIVDLYRAGESEFPEKLFAICGGDVARSLSPAIHNTLFQRRRLPFLYLPVTATCLAEDLIALDSIGRNLYGVSLTIPFKRDFGAVAQGDETTVSLGAANTLVRRRPECLDLSAHNTDTAAVREILRGHRVSGVRALVLGNGGMAAAAVYACKRAGCEVGVAGRHETSVRAFARKFGAEVFTLGRLPDAGADVLINTTPIGSAEEDPSPFPASLLDRKPLVIDAVYRRGGETPLVELARRRGCPVVDGFELLARQAVGQAKFFGVPDATGEEISAIVKEYR